MSTSSQAGRKAAKKATRSPRKGSRAKSGSAARTTAPRRSKPTPATTTRGKQAKAERPKTRKKQPSKPVDVEVDPDVLEFIEALDRFKRENGRPFPTWSEVLWVVRSLGYAKQR